MTMRNLTASEIEDRMARMLEIEAQIAANAAEIAKLRAQYFATTNNNSQESQNTKNTDNQKKPDYASADDTRCQQQLRSEQPNATYAAYDPGQGQYGISRADLTQRPCAAGNYGNHEQRGQLTAELAGEWSKQELGEAPDGTVFLRDLDVYMPGDDTPFLWFEVDSDGFFVYVYDDDEKVLARSGGGTLTWDDGTVYRRVCGDNVQDTVKEHICDLSSNITAATAEEQYRTLNQEELAEELQAPVCDLSYDITTTNTGGLVLPSSKEERQSSIADGLGGTQEPPSSQEELFAVRGLLILPGLLTTDQTFAVKDEPFTVDDYYASGIDDYDFDYNFKLPGDDNKSGAIVAAGSGANIEIICAKGTSGLLDTGQPLLDSFF